MTSEEVAVKIEQHNQKITGAEHRIKDLEEETKLIQDLVVSVKELAINMKQMIDEQKEQGSRLRKLEDEPAERWNSAKKTAFNTIIGAIAGALATGAVALIAQFI